MAFKIALAIPLLGTLCVAQFSSNLQKAGFQRDKPTTNALLKQILAASTVAVVVYPETDTFGRKAAPADREVQAEVEQKIRGWKRYIFVDRVQDADIVIAVRTGAVAKPRVGIETSTSHPPRLAIGTDVGSTQDMLAVYRGGAGAFEASPLWRDVSTDGLSLPTLPAVDRLKTALQKAEKEK